MRRFISSAPAVVFIALALALVTPAAAEETVTENDGTACCFTNPRYTGVCKVTPGPDETCGDILAYLNNQASVGKTYCGNTKVRGGWAQVDCDSQTSVCTPDGAAHSDTSG